ncbi:kinesin-like protein KIF20B [Trichomycterus rosablanca]|uniref:kinesin-like protein KIF20B n=1 Tax=Trichomycterus rosablanca TaxID=2290929 RepID=UPI002F34F3D0
MMDSCFNDKVARAETIVVEDLRRDLNFDLTEFADSQDSSGLDREFLQVYLRIRPFSAAEIENNESQDCVTIQPPDTVLLKAPRSSLSARASDKPVPQTAQRFSFSQVFGPDTSQKDLFDGTVRNLVMNVLEGRNSLVFTYGVTNAGKTFTFLGPEHDVGVLPRSLNMIFSSLEGRIFTQMSVKPLRCHEVLKLTKQQQVEENLSKRQLLRLLKESDSQKSSFSSLSSSRSEGSDLADMETWSGKRSFSLDLDPHTQFSIWVSFCEIYNENIHDLLEQSNSTAVRRANLRLCQDIKGNSFIKDLRWVQVNSADEAFKVMKLGKKNQSISSTKLNQLSSRSHSIFSVRMLRIDDVETLRVRSVSELSLCDLAGSERCGKTQNKGERLKEAGNINTSLLSLGKCINALKGNQQARHHVPFRESKLTHYLQGFFTGRGKAAMIVNINQCASMYDETLNVLKFSAVAQKVVVLSTPAVLPLVVKRSAREVSFIINRATGRGSRRTSLLKWEQSLEDVQEDELLSEDEEEEEQSVLEETLQEDEDDEGKETVLLDKDAYQNQLLFIEELKEELRTARAEAAAVEERIREEVTKEFSQLFSQMQADYSERVSKERELAEQRCERRLEIFKALVEKTSQPQCEEEEEPAKLQENERPSLDGMIDSMCGDLAGIRKDAEAAQSCLVTLDPPTLRLLEKKVADLTEQLGETRKLLDDKTQELNVQSSLGKDLEEMKVTLQGREQRVEDLMMMCVEKDEMITKVQAALDRSVEDNSRNSALIKNLLQLKDNCTCSERRTRPETRKRRQEGAEPHADELHGQPPSKKETLEDSAIPEDTAHADDSPVLEVKEILGRDLESYRAELRRKDEQIADLQRERQTLEFCIRELRSRLERWEPPCSETLREMEQMICEEQEQQFQSIMSRLNIMENKLGTARMNAGLLKTSLQSRPTRDPGAEEIKTLRRELEENEHTRDALQAEVVILKGVIKDLESRNAQENPEHPSEARTSSTETLLAHREAELAQKEAELEALQEEAQEARKREVERRRELLAVAEEAIAQKDAELEERQAEIDRMKEEVRRNTEKMKSLSVDAQRREDESDDLREKLADSKKQIQQVQREISSMRDEEKALKQKLADLEKIKSQLQNDLHNRDRIIQQLKSRRLSESKPQNHTQLYEKALKDLQQRECMMEEMKLVLSEQEETQTQMDVELESREAQIQQLTQELENLKELLRRQKTNHGSLHHPDPARTDAREEAARAQEELQGVSVKHRAERRKWLDEKLLLISQVKEAEERRNQDMRRYAEDRERHARQLAETESLKERLVEREQEMERWRRERDALVSALEFQLKKLVSTIAEKDQQIKALTCSNTKQPPEVVDGGLKDLQDLLKERDEEIQRLQQQLRETAPTPKISPPTTHSYTQTASVEDSLAEPPLDTSTLRLKHTRTRASVTSQGSCGSTPSVLDSSVISTEAGRCSRFPRPELEISFSSLQPERFRLKRPGQHSAVTVNLTRKRKSSEVDRKRGSSRKIKARCSAAPQDGVENENRRNTRCKKTPALPAHPEEEMSPALVVKSSHSSQSSLKGKKEGKFPKIGDLLNSSPNFLGSKAKRIMGLMSGKSPDEGGSSLKRPKRKIKISSPMNISANQFISGDVVEEKEIELNMKRRLRSKTQK